MSTNKEEVGEREVQDTGVTYQLDKTDAENELHIVKCIVIRNKYIDRLRSLCSDIEAQHLPGLSIKNKLDIQNTCDVIRESQIAFISTAFSGI